MLLPVVERELRVAARQKRTWLWRVLAVFGAILVLGFVYWDRGQRMGTAVMGSAMFEAILVFAFFFCLLAGPLVAADALSSEKRNGTLGLLFLTNLRAYDVVLGKLSVSAVHMFLILLAITPILAIPLVMGGVTFSVFFHAFMALADTMLLSLCTTVLASALFQSWRVALMVSVVVLVILSFGIIIFGEGVLHWNHQGDRKAFYYMFCPSYGMDLALSQGSRNRPAWHFYLNLSATFTLSLVWIGLACWIIARARWDRESPRRMAKWRAWWRHGWSGSTGHRLQQRNKLLAVNPLVWLDSRKHLAYLTLWLAVIAYYGGLFWYILDNNQGNGRSLPYPDCLISWGVAYYVFCIWLVVQAGHRFAEDRQSGALELLLTTPLTTEEYLRGRWLALRSQFWAPFALLWLVPMPFALNTWGFYRYRPSGDFWLVLMVFAVLPVVQCWALIWIALHQGLVNSSVGRATFSTLWRGVGLAWLVVMGFYIVAYWGGGRFRVWWNTNLLIWILILAHFAFCLAFAWVARQELKQNFRQLAAAPVKIHGWQLLLQRIKQRRKANRKAEG